MLHASRFALGSIERWNELRSIKESVAMFLAVSDVRFESIWIAGFEGGSYAGAPGAFAVAGVDY